MKRQKPLIKTLLKHESDQRPVWMMRQAGRYLPEYRKIRGKAGSFLDLCYSPELAEEVTLQPLRRFDLDAAILFADILLIPHALGQSVSFREGDGPVLDPVRDDASVARLSMTDLQARLQPVFETVDRLSNSVPSNVALIGFCGAPWTVATYMIEGGTSRDRKMVRRAAWEALNAPENWFNRLMDLLVESSTDYLVNQVRAGAEVLQIFETWALDLPDVLFRKYCIDPIRRIVEGVRETYPEIPIIGFPRGAGYFAGAFCEQVKVNGLGCDWGVDLGSVDKATNGKYVLQGNLDPLCLLVGGRGLVDEVHNIVRMSVRGRHIFNLGHGILPETPVENVELMLRSLRMAEQEE